MSPGGDPEERLVAQLTTARGLGFLGPGPIEDQIRHAEAFVAAISDRTGPLLDLGSGGGLPGLVLALRRPDLEIVLLDATAARVELLRASIGELGVDGRVEVAHGRAEVLGRTPLRGTFDVVTARSFGPPAATAECAAPFLRVGGVLVVSEPPEGVDRWPVEGVARVGMTPTHRVDGPPRLQVLEQTGPCPEELPRRDGVPAKRPLF